MNIGCEDDQDIQGLFEANAVQRWDHFIIVIKLENKADFLRFDQIEETSEKY